MAKTKMKTQIKLETTFDNVIVVLKVSPYYEGLNDLKFNARAIDIPKKFFMKIPLNIEIESSLENLKTSLKQYVNYIIVNQIEAITEYINATAREKNVREADGVDFEIISVTSENNVNMDKENKILIFSEFQEKGIAQWIPM